MLRDCFRRLTNFLSIANHIYSEPTKLNLKFNESRSLARGYVKGLIQARQELPRDKHPSDLLESVLHAQGFDAPMDDHIDEFFTLLFAGQDTTAVTLACAFYHFATKPDIQSNIHQEVTRVEADNINKLHYTRAVLTEVLRLHPAIDATSRMLEMPMKSWPFAS